MKPENPLGPKLSPNEERAKLYTEKCLKTMERFEKVHGSNYKEEDEYANDYLNAVVKDPDAGNLDDLSVDSDGVKRRRPSLKTYAQLQGEIDLKNRKNLMNAFDQTK